MDNQEFSDELEKRTRKFAVRIINLSIELANTLEGRAKAITSNFFIRHSFSDGGRHFSAL